MVLFGLNYLVGGIIAGVFMKHRNGGPKVPLLKGLA